MQVMELGICFTMLIFFYSLWIKRFIRLFILCLTVLFSCGGRCRHICSLVDVQLWSGMAFQPCYHGLVASDCLFHIHQNISIFWQKQIHAGTEFDESHLLVHGAGFTFACVGHDAAGQGTCYLAHQYACLVGCLDDDGGPFVLVARFWQIGRHEVAVVVYIVGDGAVYGIPVGVYIEYAHEYGYLDAALVQALFLSVGSITTTVPSAGGQHHVVLVAIKQSRFGFRKN